MATILFLHGWRSRPGRAKPTYLANHGHTVINPQLPDYDFAESIRIAQAEFSRHRPAVVVGSSRGGAVAMNIHAEGAGLVLLCPAWKHWGKAKTVPRGTVIIHSEGDNVIPIAHSRELLKRSDLEPSALIVVGTNHRLRDPDSLAAMLAAVETAVRTTTSPGQTG